MPNENYFKNEALIRKNEPEAPEVTYPMCKYCENEVAECGDICDECHKDMKDTGDENE